MRVENRTGSGFFISEDRRLLTAKHLFLGSDQRPLTQIAVLGQIGTHQGRSFPLPAGALRLHPEFDVAMLTAADPSLAHRALPLCFDQPRRTGERIVALGFPRGQDYDQTDGTIRTTTVSFGEAWLTGADVNPGNSGGPALSLAGSVVGIVLGGFRERDIQGQNVILPLRVARNFIADVATIQQNCSGGAESTACVGGRLIPELRPNAGAPFNPSLGADAGAFEVVQRCQHGSELDARQLAIANVELVRSELFRSGAEELVLGQRYYLLPLAVHYANDPTEAKWRLLQNEARRTESALNAVIVSAQAAAPELERELPRRAPVLHGLLLGRALLLAELTSAATPISSNAMRSWIERYQPLVLDLSRELDMLKIYLARQ
nr:serine protease [Neoroseomonas marina]